MAGKIQLTPAELKAQAAEMSALSAEYEMLFSGVSSSLKNVNSNWSANLSRNFEGKITSAQNAFKGMTENLTQGATIATTSANTFESVDSLLAKNDAGEASQSKQDNIETIQIISFLNGDWIDEQFPDLPLWARKQLKKALMDSIHSDYDSVMKAAKKVSEGEYLEAIKEITSIFCEKDGFFAGLVPEFYLNTTFGMLDAYVQYFENPTISNFFNIGWQGTVGAVLETASDSAWGLISSLPIPGLTDWYEERGVTDAASAFNVAYSEIMGAIFGEEMGEYCGSYYEEHGGLWGGLVHGVTEIVSFGWNSIFS